MTVLKSHKKSITIFLIPILILIGTVLVTSFSKKENVVNLTSELNPYLPELSSELFNQVLETIEKDSVFVYSAKFYSDVNERRLVLINKNPSKRELLNNIQIHVYPQEKNKFKNVSNYNPKGYLDYTSKDISLQHQLEEDNYGVRVINIPFINIEKVFILQPGIWKQTIKNPFQDLVLDNSKVFNGKLENSSLYLPILQKAFAQENIQYSQNNKKQLAKNSLEVKDPITFWWLLSNNSNEAINLIENKNPNSKLTLETLNSLLEEKKVFTEVFDIEKLASYYALINLFSNNSSKKLGLVYNEKTSLIEPYYLNQNGLGEYNTYIKNQNILNEDYKKVYAQKLNYFSSLNINTLLENTPNLDTTIKQANNIDPSIVFKKSILTHNQLVLEKGVKPSTGIKAEFIDLKDNKLTVSVKNLTDFSIRINDLNFQTKKSITKPSSKSIIKSNQKDTISFILPRSFENLFVHKKSKTTGFIFEKNIIDLNVSYSLVGLNNYFNTEIVPYQATQNYNKSTDLFRQVVDFKSSDYCDVNSNDKTINFTKNFTIKNPLILPEGYTISANPGVEINIEEGGKIISYSPFNFIGTKEKPVKIISKDKEGQGLLVLANGKLSQLNYVYFDGLTNPSHGAWSTTSAVTFYESPVNFDYVKTENNSCEDAINVVRANFKMTNTLFRNTQSDAFDGDFVNGIINSCVFENLGNDAIDVSGSDLRISNVKIIKAGDKALSAGEDSKMTIDNVKVIDCAIALAGKDLSIVSIKNLDIKDTKLGFTAFQKKPEFGPSNITASNITMTNVETDYLIENTSSLMVDGKKIETKLADVKSKMYGVEFGVSSDETRNRKRN